MTDPLFAPGLDALAQVVEGVIRDEIIYIGVQSSQKLLIKSQFVIALNLFVRRHLVGNLMSRFSKSYFLLLYVKNE